MTEVILTIDPGETEVVLDKLSVLLEPTSLGAWLENVVNRQLQDRAKNRFTKEGDDVTGKWAPLTDATQDIRASLNYGPAHPINVRTGELKAFIEGNPGRITYDELGTTLTIPGDQPTGALNDKFMGAQQGEGRAPARPVLSLNSKDMAAAVTALEAYIREGTGIL